MTALTDDDRRRIAQARALADLEAGEDAIREHLGTAAAPTCGMAMTYAAAFGAAQSLLGGLADIAERLGGAGDQAAEDTRRLGEIRAALAAFDWEHDDRQYALEAIERIVAGDDDQEDDDQADDDTCACSTCGALIGIFPALGLGWNHYRGDGTVASPVEIYDAGHEATFTVGPGGAS